MSDYTPDVKLKAQVNFPANVSGGTAIDVAKANGRYTIDLDVSGIVENSNISAGDVAASWMLIWNKPANSYQRVPFALGATAGVASISGKIGALGIGNGLQFTGDTLELLPSNVIYLTGLTTSGDNGPAINTAIAALPPGGRLVLPATSIPFSTPINLDGRTNVHIVGQGTQTGGADSGTVLRFTGVGNGDAISMRGTNVGCSFKDIKLAYNNSAFTGNLINIGNGVAAGTGSQRFENLTIADDSGAHTACLVYLGGGSQLVSFDRVTLNGGHPSVKGKDLDDPDHFANVISFRVCAFQGHNGPAVLFGGVDWTFDTCDIEPDKDGGGNFYAGNALVPAEGVVFNNCFIADATTAGQWIVFHGTGLVITSGVIGGSGAGAQYGVVLHNAEAVKIEGVTFGSLSVAISFDNSAVDATGIKFNKFITCATLIADYGSRGGAVVCEGNTPRTDLDPAVASATWNPPSVSNGAQVSTNVTVTGAGFGDRVQVSFSNDIQGLALSGYVIAVDTVSVALSNQTGGAVDLGSGTLRVRVTKW